MIKRGCNDCTVGPAVSLFAQVQEDEPAQLRFGSPDDASSPKTSSASFGAPKAKRPALSMIPGGFAVSHKTNRPQKMAERGLHSSCSVCDGIQRLPYAYFDGKFFVSCASVYAGRNLM